MKNIYFGTDVKNNIPDTINIENSITSEGMYLQIPSPDMSDTGNPLKLDILYYNTVNRVGEVLSSIVAFSNVRDAEEEDEFTYSPTTLLASSELEVVMSKTGDSNRWLNADLLQGELKLIVNQSYKPTHGYSSFNIESDYAVTPYPNKYMYDGWYSVVTVAPDSLSTASTIPAGTLRELSGGIQYALIDNPASEADWSSITTIDTTVPIANILRNEVEGNPFLQREFFVIHRLNALYNGVIYKTLEKEWFTRIKAIKPKIVGINICGDIEAFVECQHIINSLDIALINQII